MYICYSRKLDKKIRNTKKMFFHPLKLGRCLCNMKTTKLLVFQISLPLALPLLTVNKKV